MATAVPPARVPERLAAVSPAAYVVALIATALLPGISAPALASSPDGVAPGHVLALLTSGLVIDGPVAPQIALVAVVLIAGVRVLGAAPEWAAALGAHVGATVLGYAGRHR